MEAPADREVRRCRIELEFAATLPTDELAADAAIEGIRTRLVQALQTNAPPLVFDESFVIRSWDDVPEGAEIE